MHQNTKEEENRETHVEKLVFTWTWSKQDIFILNEHKLHILIHKLEATVDLSEYKTSLELVDVPKIENSQNPYDILLDLRIQTLPIKCNRK